MNDSNYIIHTGVLGMKWGVRKSKKSVSSSSTSKGKKSGNRSVKKMDDAELKKKINRLQMEQQYKKLIANTKALSSGKKFVTNVLVGAATGVASGYASKYIDRGAKYVGNRIVKSLKK